MLLFVGLYSRSFAVQICFPLTLPKLLTPRSVLSSPAPNNSLDSVRRTSFHDEPELSLARGLLDQQASRVNTLLTEAELASQTQQKNDLAAVQPQILVLATKTERTAGENQTFGILLAKDPAPEVISSRRQTDQLMASLSRGGEWKELPGTRLELQTLSELFSDHATVLADHTASESQIETLRKDDKLGEFRYLHFASHGSANNIRAFDSALILSQDDPEKQEFAPMGTPWINGQISALEVLEYWKLDAELVTLSACQTGLGRKGGGDGLLGFAQAFLLAGSRSVCLSLWEVDDRATALLMDRFYRNLLGKRKGLTQPMPKAAALAEAKQWLRNLTQDEVAQRLAGLTNGVSRAKDQPALKVIAPSIDPAADPKQIKPFDHPRFWAAFILIGDPN